MGRVNRELDRDAAVELVDLVKRYGAAEAVRGITLQVRDGEFLAIIGPSGCGKTATLRMIAGLETPTSGEIFIHGEQVTQTKSWKRDVPLVWQSFALFPHLTVAQNVEFGLRMRGVGRRERRERASRALETVGLTAFADRAPTQLSGGQKQRVGLARALVLDPRVLLLDEPLGALDARIARTMQSELRRLHKDLGITFIYVTHNQSEALAMADRIVVMNAGAIQQQGTPREVFREPRNRFVAEFVGTNNIFTGDVRAVDGHRVAVQTPQGLFWVDVTAGRTWRIGQPATFIVAADRIATGTNGCAEDNRVEGRVTAIEFVGAVATLFVELTGDAEFRIQKPEQHMQHGDAVIGAPVAAGWRAGDAFLLPDDSL